MADHPFEEICKAAEERIKQGHLIFQKWTCSHCHTRQTMPDPNTLYTHGMCEECDSLTDIKKQGCNFLLVAGWKPSVSHTK